MCVGALIGARSVHGSARTARVLAAAIVAAIPFTWFVLGFAAQFGFYNATLTLLLLLWVLRLSLLRTAPKLRKLLLP